jgi:predicted ATPase
MLEAVLGVFVALTHQQPLLVVFEDVHWIDPSSRELLRLFGERAKGLPVFLLITFRPEFDSSLWKDQAHVTTLALRRLDRDEGAAVIGGIVRGKALPDEIMEEIVAKTDGVPLFVEELTKMILESGLLEDRGDRYELVGPLPPLAIPATLQDSLMARLDRLGRVKELAQIGAAIGQSFSYCLLAAIATFRGVELQSALDQLVNAGLVVRREDAQQASYAFRHALVQDAAYQSLLRSTRVQLHTRIAGVLEERFPEAAETEPEFLAHHCTQANLVDKAIGYRLRAGMRAIERSGAVEAASQLEKGLELMPGTPTGPKRDEQELRLQVALAAVLVGARGYPAPETSKILTRARELCKRTGDRAHTLPVLFLQNALHITRAEFQAVRDLGEEMQRLGHEWGDTGAELMGGHQLGAGLHALGEFDLARVQFEQVLALYDPEQHRPLTFLYAQNPRVSGLSYLSCILFTLGYPEQALRRSEEAIAGASELAHFNTTAFALVWASVLAQLRGDPQAAKERSKALISLCNEQRLLYWLAAGHIVHGWALAASGKPEIGTAELRQGLATWQAMGAEYFLPKILALQVETRRETGYPAESALDLLSEALGRAEKTGERWFDAELHRLRGECLLSLPTPDQPAAERAFLCAIDVARAQRAKMWELRATLCLARLWRDQGKKEDALALLLPVYTWFTEGLDTPELCDAAAVLEDLRP